MHIRSISIAGCALAVAFATGCGESKSDAGAGSTPSSAAAGGHGGVGGSGGSSIGGGGASVFGESQIGVGRAHDPAWVTHFGGTGEDEAFGVTASSTGIFVSGQTSSAMFGAFDDACVATGQHAGEDCADAFVMNADAGQGVQFGGQQEDSARGVVVDGASLYLGGKSREDLSANYQNDGWVKAFSADLAQTQWEVPIANPNKVDEVLALTFSDGVFACGGSAAQLTPNAPGPNTDENMFVASLSATGTQVAMNQFGSKNFEELMAVAADADGVYLVGQTGGYLDDDPNGGKLGSTDALLVVMDRSLDPALEICRVQFGTSGKDVAQGIAVAGDYIYLAGWTEGTMNGALANGATCNQDDSPPSDEFRADAFLAKYDKSCNHVWTRQFGTKGGDIAEAVAADAQYEYVVGSHGGTGDHADNTAATNAFLRVYDAEGALVGEVVFATGPDLTVTARAVAVDESFVYVAGGAEGDLGPTGSNLGGRDVFLARIPLADARGGVNASGTGCP